MDNITLTPTTPLDGFAVDIGPNRIVEQSNAIVSVATPLGGEEELAKVLKNSWSLDMPEPRQSSLSGDMRAIRTAPDQLLLIFKHPTHDADAFVKPKISGAGYSTDQTDVWVQLEVSGPSTLAALERLCPIDLHIDTFPTNANARTIFEHMGTIIVRLGDNRFLLLSASSSARSFLHAIEASFHYTATP